MDYRERQDRQLALQARQQIEYCERKQKEREMAEAEQRPAHSPLGASGAERWMNCPGSVALIKELAIPEEEHEYTKEGTALHKASEFCLLNGADTWEIVGQKFGDIEITDPMAMAVQVYLDTCRPDIDRAKVYRVEFQVSSPVHKDFYGTADFVALFPDRLVIRDLKGGEGIYVDPEDNPQLKYYGFGVIDTLERLNVQQFPDEFPVSLEIVQPRLFCEAGPYRTWETTVGAIKEWVGDTLVPAMCRAEYDQTLDAGEHCRFCPAKLVCPLLTSLFRAACTYDPAHVKHYNDESIGRSYRYIEAVKHYIKALQEETERRLLAGKEVTGAKLVKKKANRVWKTGAEDLAKARFGPEAITLPTLKTPPQIEALGPEAKEFVKEFAYTPDTGLTVAPAGDPRAVVKLKTAADTFAAGLAAVNEPV